MWTRVADMPERMSALPWNPNHFVPCIPASSTVQLSTYAAVVKEEPYLLHQKVCSSQKKAAPKTGQAGFSHTSSTLQGQLPLADNLRHTHHSVHQPLPSKGQPHSLHVTQTKSQTSSLRAMPLQGQLPIASFFPKVQSYPSPTKVYHRGQSIPLQKCHSLASNLSHGCLVQATQGKPQLRGKVSSPKQLPSSDPALSQPPSSVITPNQPPSLAAASNQYPSSFTKPTPSRSPSKQPFSSHPAPKETYSSVTARMIAGRPPQQLHFCSTAPAPKQPSSPPKQLPSTGPAHNRPLSSATTLNEPPSVAASNRFFAAFTKSSSPSPPSKQPFPYHPPPKATYSSVAARRIPVQPPKQLPLRPSGPAHNQPPYSVTASIQPHSQSLLP